MPKNPLVRTLMVSQHVKESETLLKSARQYFNKMRLFILEIIDCKKLFSLNA